MFRWWHLAVRLVHILSIHKRRTGGGPETSFHWVSGGGSLAHLGESHFCEVSDMGRVAAQLPYARHTHTHTLLHPMQVPSTTIHRVQRESGCLVMIHLTCVIARRCSVVDSAREYLHLQGEPLDGCHCPLPASVLRRGGCGTKRLVSIGFFFFFDP